MSIGRNVWISQYVYIDEVHPDHVRIGDNVTIGMRCTIFAHFYSGNYEPGKTVSDVIIEKNAYLGPHCVIFHGVTIGEGAVIAAGTIVTKSVPAGVLFGSQSAAKPLAKVTRPLVKGENMNYENFLLGLRQL